MNPVLVELSQFKPFGLSLQSLSAKAVAFAVLAVVAMLIGSCLSRRRARRGPGRPGIIDVLCVAALGVVAVGLLWVVSKAHGYGLMMGLGFLTAMGVARWRTRRCGEDPEVINNVGVLALVCGILGARMSYIVEHWSTFAAPIGVSGANRTVGERLVEVFKVTSGGLVFDGGLILAIAAVLLYLYRSRLPVRRFMDILAIGAMVGLAFGRAGCLLNGCCYGGVCQQDFSLALHFPYAGEPLVYPHDGPNPYPPGAGVSPAYHQQFESHAGLVVPPELLAAAGVGRQALKQPGELLTPQEFAAARKARALGVHPAQVYGIVNALVLAALLCAVMRLRSREGQVFGVLLVLYPITRFVLEYIRDDNPGMALTPAQYKCIVLLAGGVGLLAWLRRMPASCGPVWARRRPATQGASADQVDAKPPRRRPKHHNR